MKKSKLKIVVISLLFACFAVNNLIPFGVSLKYSNQTDFSEEYSEIMERSIYNVNIENLNFLSQEISLFGYKLKAEDKNSIDRDETGLLTLNQKKFDFIDVFLKLESGEYEYKDVPIHGEIYIYSQETDIFSYDIEDPLRGFFMDMDITSDKTFINLAFDGGDCQLCYQGLSARGYSSINAYLTKEIEVIQLTTENIIKSEFQSIPFDELENNLKEQQKNNIKIYQRESLDGGVATSGSGVTYTQYGIAHEECDISTTTLPERLPDDFWKPYSEIDVGIYRSEPGEAIIKSDLQFYNKDYYQIGGQFWGYVRDIKAYTIYAEGIDIGTTNWKMENSGKITPNEIKNLWYYQYISGVSIVDVHPNDMIIYACVCYGYSDSPSGTPYMAKAFVDYGALAFMGATVLIPVKRNDDFTVHFWWFLCQGDHSVYEATLTYISFHNRYIEEYLPDMQVDWVYGTHIKIYGNINGILDN